MSKPILKNLIGRSSLLVAIGVLTISAIASSQEDADAALTCKQQDSVFFTSDTPNIAVFDAAQHGATLVQVLPLPEANLNIYIFNPGEIICAIKADQDTSSVNL